MFNKFPGEKLVIGLLHIKAMPGNPYYKDGFLEQSVELAVKGALALKNGGAHGCLIQGTENVYSVNDDADPARVATMAIVTSKVREAVGDHFLVGAQLMWNCITPSLAVAKVAGADFTRCTALVGKVDSIYGTIEPNPLKVMTYRHNIMGDHITLVSEIAGTHHHISPYDPVAVQRLAIGSMRVGAGAVEIHGNSNEMVSQIISDVRKVTRLPIILGGGTNLDNCRERLALADGVFVGECFEGGRRGSGTIDESIVKEYMARIKDI